MLLAHVTSTCISTCTSTCINVYSFQLIIILFYFRIGACKETSWHGQEDVWRFSQRERHLEQGTV